MKIKKLLFTIISVCLTSSIFAQEMGNIRGRVIDKLTKQPLVGVNISVIETPIGTATNQEGSYLIEGVEESIYKLEIQFIGYHTFIKTDVRVTRNKTTYVEEIELTETAIEGDTIIVIAEGAFAYNKDAPVSNYSYTREEINRSPGAAGDIFRAIGTLPGVNSSGAEFSAFSVRGGNPQENIIMIDNIPFSKVTHLEGGGTEEELGQGGRFSIFSPGLIEKADFQAGGFPVRYGGKNASIISLNICEGNKDNMTLNGYIDLLGWEVNYNGPSYILDNTSLLFSFRHQDLTNILKMIDQKDQGYPKFSDLIFKTTTDINHNNKISVLGIYAPEKFERTIDNVYESENLYATNMPIRKEVKNLFGIKWRYLTSNNSFLTNTFYYTKSDLDLSLSRAYTDPIKGQVPSKDEAPIRHNIYVENEVEYTYGLRSEFNITTPGNSVFTCGLELQKMDFDYSFIQNSLDTLYVFDQNDYRPDPNQNFIVREPENVSTDFIKELYDVASYLQYSFTLADIITFTPGLRFDYHNYNKQVYITPRLSLQYSISTKTSLNASGGVFYQKPQPKIIAFSTDNKELKDEIAYHFIIGISRYLGDDFKLNVETYYKILDDLVFRPDRGSMFVTNKGEGWAAGIDFSLIKRFVDKFYGQLNYSYAVSKRDDRSGYGEYNSEFNKPHILNILAGYEFNKEWNFSARWQYASGHPQDGYIIHSDVHNNIEKLRYSKEITSNNSRRLPDSHSLNIRVDYRKQFQHFAIITFIDIINVYGHLNVTEERFQERDGSVEKQGFEIIPSFGLKLEL